MKLLSATFGAVKITALMIVMSASVMPALASAKVDTIQIYKNNVDKAHRISLYPDANQKVVFFSVRGQEGRAYQLYVFNIEGKVVAQAEIRNKQTTIIKGIEKGSYLFEVFSDDTRIGNGRIAVK